MKVDNYKMASGITNDDSDPLECTVCLEPYKEPKMLPCYHTFCLECLVSYVHQNGVATRNGQQFTCPNCRQSTFVPAGGVCKFQTNFYIEAIRRRNHLEDRRTPLKNRVISTGMNTTGARSTEVLGSLDLMLIKKAVGDGINVREPCSHVPSHKGELFCERCLVAICKVCANNSHKDHSLRFVVDIFHETRNSLGEARYKAIKMKQYLAGIKQDCSDYAEGLIKGFSEIRMEVANQRKAAHELIDTLCEDFLKGANERLHLELERVDKHKAELDELLHRGSAIHDAAEDAQVGDIVTMVKTDQKTNKECREMNSLLPGVLKDKKIFCFEKPQQTLNNLLLTGNVYGIIQDHHTTSHQLDQGSNQNMSAEPISGGDVTETSFPIQKEQHSLTAITNFLEISQTAKSQLEPDHNNTGKLVNSFLVDKDLEIKHIIPSCNMTNKAWICYGQASPVIVLVSDHGQKLQGVHTRGDACGCALLDQHTGLIASPANRIVRNICLDADGGDDNVHGSVFASTSFPPTCVTVGSIGIAVAGKRNLIFSPTIDGLNFRWVINNEDLLQKPCSLTFSKISGSDILAIADRGPRAVYIFYKGTESRNFECESLYEYRGEGLVDMVCKGRFNPVSVSGRDGLVAVLDQSTCSVALLGEQFSVVGIVSLIDLEMPVFIPSALAFASFDVSCTRVWIGDRNGFVYILDLPKPVTCD